MAQLSGDGYYRVQSYDRGRYIRLVDNRGSINISTTSADMNALRTVLGFDRVVSDPATVIYIKKQGSGYDLQSQGTSSYTIIGYLLQITDTGDGTYWASASKSGMTKYLWDEIIDDESEAEKLTGYVQTMGTPKNSEADWNIIPMSRADNYFGVKPTVSVNNSHYATFYAAFPFTFNSTGMNAYSVAKVDEENSVVIINEVTGGVQASVPVLIKCSSVQPVDNKLNVGASATGNASGNLLKGVYFCNDVTSTKHRNVVAYDATTMRVLGTAPDGSLAFVKSSTLQYIPANTAYITVEAGAPDVLKVYTQAEYDALPSAMRGDLSGDGKVSGLDLVYMGNMIIGTREKTAEADLNGDGKVSGLDYVILVNIILNQQ